MWRLSLSCGALVLVLLGLRPSAAGAQAAVETNDDKIANALSAAPPEIAQDATVKDWPAREGGELTVLRQGSNDWVCLPDAPSSPGNDPMCLDPEWQNWAAAYMTKAKPQTKQVGISYMLSSDAEASNTDPFATGPTPDNQWHRAGPHIMVLTPDLEQLEGISSDHESGGPYVMWGGTPYAHVMIPVSSGGHAAESHPEHRTQP